MPELPEDETVRRGLEPLLVGHRFAAVRIAETRLRYPLDGASDHGVSEAIYLSDPDGNGVELYRDRPEADWPRDAAGELKMVTAPLDLQALLAEAE